MKRIRRRPNRTGSERLSNLRRSISHPASRRESLVPKDGNASSSGKDSKDNKEETKPLLGDNSMKDASIKLTDLEADAATTIDLEAGCTTYEKPKNSSRRQLLSRGGGTRSFRASNRPQQQHCLCLWTSRLYLLWENLPLFLKYVLVVHAATCTFALYCVYSYWRFHAGFYWAWFWTLSVGFVFHTSTLLALLVARSTRVELEALLDQEGRSRAILNTLYPARVLEQMYSELQPDQISQAQQQQVQQRFENSLSTAGFSSLNTAANFNVSSRSLLDSLDAQIVTQQTDSPPRSPPRRTQSDRKRLLNLKSQGSFRKQLSFERQNETGEVSVVVVERTPSQVVDRKKLGYEDTSQTNHHSDNHSKQRQQSPKKGSCSHCNHVEEDEVFVVKRNSLSLRRKSMTRRHSQSHLTNNNMQPKPETTGSFLRRLSIASFAPHTTGHHASPHHSHSGNLKQRRSSMGGSVSSNASSNGRPIQEKFSDCTVLFADIAGFTNWCSERDPSHVFRLLESVFFAFDNLAKNLGVYKIETIGDCYVAVTGLPKPMDGHAAAMALFASQIILEFDIVVALLANESEEEGGLGADTALLRLRAGCHSGPVTAGVLRGDKGRFQLFGDTVNTAARMESNGMAGKVQISEEMAQTLEHDGKNDWFHPRPDKITAKGKGLLNTYWLNDNLMAQIKLQQKSQSAKTDKKSKADKNKNPPSSTSKTPIQSNTTANAPAASARASMSSTQSEQSQISSQSQHSQQQPQSEKIYRRPTPPRIKIKASRSLDLNDKKDAPPSRPTRATLLHAYDEEPVKFNTHRISIAEMQAPCMWLSLEVQMSAPQQQLADWNFQQLELLVKKIIAHHTASQMDASANNDWGNTSLMMDECWDIDAPLQYEEYDGSILEELRDASDTNLIPSSKSITVNHEKVVLPAPVVLELQAFVKTLEANFQKQQPFHNFLHSCHMTRSMVQLLQYLEQDNSHNSSSTCGAACGVLPRDPLAQFVIVLTCMVQDVDHPGVTNEQLMKEDADMADYFHNTCLTQQNALDVAWESLVGPTCQNLLGAICSHSSMELERFRKYMLHAMLATDREDKELAQERFTRWMKVANPTGTTKAKDTWQQSIAVIEQCMQMSNLIHTVQSPPIFHKWTERCFRELYLAYINGRRDKDPNVDFYDRLLEKLKRTVIPLAERFQSTHNNAMMGTCEDLQRQAKANLEDWKANGHDMVERMASCAKYEFGERQLDGSIKHVEEELDESIKHVDEELEDGSIKHVDDE